MPPNISIAPAAAVETREVDNSECIIQIDTNNHLHSDTPPPLPLISLISFHLIGCAVMSKASVMFHRCGMI